MKRITTLMSLILFAFVGAPLAALADPNEAGAKAVEQRSEKAAADSNGQWSETAKKAQEHAAEYKSEASEKLKSGTTDAKTKAHPGKRAPKAKVEPMKGSAKAKAHETARDAAAKANPAASGATDKAKGKLEAAMPGMGASGGVEAGGSAN
jgi:hypothetical protein